MKLNFAARSHVGRRRTDNEDSYLVDKGLRLFIVCDGMGGHAAGEVASSLAVRVVREAVNKSRDKIQSLSDGTVSQRQALRTVLRNAVRLASLKVYRQSQSQSELRGMGTTLTLMLAAGSRAFVAHVGDSRLYLLREGKVHQITTDHSMVNQMIRAGELDPEDAPHVPFTNALTRAVGVHPDVDVDTIEVDLLPSDRFLICSDGLHNYFEGDSTLEEALARPLDDAADWLVDFACRKGGRDNITVVLIEIEDVGDTVKSARLRLTLDTLRQIPLFQHLAYAELVRVINVSRAREVPKGEVIIRQGDEGDALYIVLEGRVRVDQSGTEVAMLGPGRHFGEMSLVDNEPRSATVVAEEATLLIRIVRDDFYNLLRQDSITAVKLLWNFIQTLSSRLRAHAPEVTTVDADDTGVHRSPYVGYEAYAKTDPELPPLDEEKEGDIDA